MGKGMVPSRGAELLQLSHLKKREPDEAMHVLFHHWSCSPDAAKGAEAIVHAQMPGLGSKGGAEGGGDGDGDGDGEAGAAGRGARCSHSNVCAYTAGV